MEKTNLRETIQQTRLRDTLLGLAIFLYITPTLVVSLSPEEFRKHYAVTDGLQIERRPHKQDKPIYGYIAPTERTYIHRATPYPPNNRILLRPHDRYDDRHVTRPDLTTITIDRYSADRPNSFVDRPNRFDDRPNSFDDRPNSFADRPNSFADRPNSFADRPNRFDDRPNRFGSFADHRNTRPQPNQPYQDVDFGSARLEQVQNLVHLRNLHSLSQTSNIRRHVPYGIIRKGKHIWSDSSTYGQDENDNSTTHSWAAKAILSDQQGQESLIVERGVRYKGPHPLLETKSRYDAIELFPEPEHSFRDRRSYQWDTEATENSVTKRPSNTLLKPHEDLLIQEQLAPDYKGILEGQADDPELRSVLRPYPYPNSFSHPITFRTKVKAGVGVESGTQSQELDFLNPETRPTRSQSISSASPFEPLASPPSSSSLMSTVTASITTTSQNEQMAVLPSPQDIYSQMAQGTTQSTYGSPYGSNSPSGPSYGPSSFTPSYGPSYGGMNPNGPSSYGGTPSYGSTSSPSYGGSDRVAKIITLERLFRLLQDPGGEQGCTDLRGVGGTCTSSQQCRTRGGTPTNEGSCPAAGLLCCISYARGCNLQTRSNGTVWVSPFGTTTDTTGTGAGGTVDPTTVGGTTPSQQQGADTCVIKVNKMSSDICHLRLDFIQFEISPPEDGVCRNDKLVVYGQNLNSGIPHLCGLNTGQHVYVDVDSVPGPLELNMVSVGDFARRWQIQITQIECSNPVRPTANCLQYYTGSSNTISSFNYRVDAQTTYTNFLNYAVCLRKEKGFCSVEYRNKPGRDTFEIINMATLADGMQVPTVGEGEAGVGLQTCPDDFLELGGTRLCGHILNDGAQDPKFTNNAPVTDNTNGPLLVKFVSDGENAGRGFSIDYQQYPC